MRWLQQQNKVEMLAAASQQEAHRMAYYRGQLVDGVRARLQQPGTMAWAFAAGVLYGTSHGKLESSSFDPLRYMNTFALLWGLLAEKQIGSE